MGNRFRLTRFASVGALIAALVLITALLLGGGGAHSYKLLFQNGGQLVPGNQVLIGGAPAGTIDDITLTGNNQAEVRISLGQVLHEGTTAVIRATSLSGVANHYISVTPGPNNAPELADGATLSGQATTTAVDLDQLFNEFRPPVRQALRQVIQGSATVYAGKGPQANQTYRYLAPALSSTDQLMQELGADQLVFQRFIIDSSSVLTAVAQRGNDLSSLVSNANTSLGAIASQNQALDRSLALLPGTLRQGNTTFVNLRAALNDLDPLVATAKPATANLAPFLRKLAPVLGRSVPVFTNLRLAVNKPGPTNDLAYLVPALPTLEARAKPAFNNAIGAVNAFLPTLSFARPYTPDLLGAVTKLGQATAYYDANGHYARAEAAALNLFNYNTVTKQLDPIPPAQQFSSLAGSFAHYRRCPGGATQAIAGSNPFLDNGNLTAADCNPGQVPPGP